MLHAGRRLAEWPAQVFLWISAAYLLILGVGSLAIGLDFSVGDDVATDHLFGVFETNGWHGLAGLLLAFASLVFVIGRRARDGALVIGASLLASGVVLLLSGDGSIALGLIPVDAADAVTLHILPGVVGLVCFYATAQR